MKVIALDLGFASTGYAVVDYAAKRLTPPIIDLGWVASYPSRDRSLYVAVEDTRRAREMARGILAIIDQHLPVAIIAEVPAGGGQSSRAVRCMALATGVLAGVLGARPDLPFVLKQPWETRKAATGRTGASKDLVIAKMGHRWPQLLEMRPKAKQEAAADALATYVAAEDDPVLRAVRQIRAEAEGCHP